MEILTRKEIKKEDKWNIDAVYGSIEEFNNDVDLLEKELDKLVYMEKNFLSNSKEFSNFFIQDEKVSRLLEKLYIYANCKNDEDKGNSVYQELKGKVINLFALYNEKTSSVIPKIIQEDTETINRYVLEQESLKPYKHFFETIINRKIHTLDEKVEKVLSMYQPVLSASGQTSSYLTNADLKLGMIKDEDGNDISLTEANYSTYIKSPNRDVRKQAFKNLYSAYSGVINTLSSTYSTTVNMDSITAKLRNYDNSISMYLNPNKIPIELYNNLISVVRNNLDTLYDYYDLKKDILNLDEFHLYDSYAKVIKDNDRKYTFDEAKDIVIKALSVYGDEYINVLKTAFSDGWIDKYPNKGKKSGAYSTGSVDTMPYVLLNFTGDYNDVSTLAHELGHSMHSYFTVKNNPYITADYPIFLAEIASTTNELLLSHYMYEHSTSKDEKLSILNEKLDLFKATIYRQTMFAEFEKNAHDYVDSGNILTKDYLDDMYYDLNKTYFGPNVVIDEDIKYEWARIPHFYTPFYVYQYATSLSISCYVALNIINKTPGFVEKYLEFLQSGGRDYPLEVLKIIDVDLKDTKVFESALKDFKNTLDEFKKNYYEK